MTISCLHHINIRTTRLEETRRFYEHALGLYVGARPDFGEDGYWLFVPGTDHPIVHLSVEKSGGPDQMVNTGNRLDHVAFFGGDMDQALARLDELGIPYSKHPGRLYLGGKMVQVFLKDPNGIVVELGFFPERDEQFRESMDEYQEKAREGDREVERERERETRPKTTA